MQVGADNYIISKDAECMAANAGSLDLILDTIPSNHDINPYLSLLKKKGTIVVLGVAMEPFQIGAFTLLFNQYRITGSATGGMKATQECINFMAEHGLQVKTEMINSIAELEQAEECLNKGNDAGVRYVLDIGKILA